MLFNSYIFILCFLPLCILGYFGLNRLRWKWVPRVFLLGMSLWFYGYFHPGYLVIILGSIAINYFAVWLMEKAHGNAFRKAVLIFAVFGNLALLFYYKYYDFFMENVNRAFSWNLPLVHVVLPLGISFFTFQQLSYVIDAYRGEVPQYGVLNYMCYVTYFPQLVAGPIVTHDEWIPQFLDESKKRFNWDSFTPGLYLFTMGLSKKVLLADMFGQAANWGFGNIPQLDSTNALMVMLAYTFQVYFDFSGYCDMAIGLGKMMNLELPVNFDSPYKACTITEFWQRWHKTLTRFFTKYVYIPMGGNRKGRGRTYLNVMVVFLISGLWHGANWTFLLWGCMHGIFSVITRHWKNQIEKVPRAINWVVTFLFLNLSWVFFRADSVSAGVDMIRQILAFDFGPVNTNILDVFNLLEVSSVAQWVFNINIHTVCPHLMTVVVYAGTMLAVLWAPNAYERMNKLRCGFMELLITVFFLVWSIFSLEGVSTFLYFNF